MATVDRVNGDWYLKSLNGNIYIDASGGNGTTTVTGNLNVIGRMTNIGTVDTLITDNIITLLANVTNTEPVLNAGIEVRRGNQPTVSLRWNETTDHWESTTDGVNFKTILSGLESDTSPRLSGNLSVNGFTIQSANNQNIIFRPGANAGLEITNTSGSFQPVSNATILVSRIPAAGESGLYVTNSVLTNEELITKRKALVYSLVL